MNGYEFFLFFPHLPSNVKLFGNFLLFESCDKLSQSPLRNLPRRLPIFRSMLALVTRVGHSCTIPKNVPTSRCPALSGISWNRQRNGRLPFFGAMLLFL